MLSPDAAAKAVCERLNWSISNLALQKILYVAQMFHLGQYDQRLINASFEAWDYGPVLPSVYRRVAMFGSKPIKNVFLPITFPTTGTEIEVLRKTADHLAEWTPGQLVDLTHERIGAWASVYQPGVRGIVIPDTLIKKEYESRVSRDSQARA